MGRLILGGTLRRAASPLALFCAWQAAPATARVEIDPSIELRQVFDLPIDDDFTTYSEAVIGVDGAIQTRRVHGQLSYRFAQRFEEVGDIANNQSHSLIARGDADVIPGTLRVDAGAFATFLNRDLRRRVSFDDDANNGNLAQTYSAYVAPSFHQRLGAFAEFDATYRIAYVNVDEADVSRLGGGVGGVDTQLGAYADSVNQSLDARFGNREASGKFRWDLAGSAQDERTDRLDQHYRSYLGRVELEYALNRDFALLGSVGYEDIKSSEEQILTDAAGVPLVDAEGHFIIDPNAPRRVSYDQDGLVYDGGFRWTPSRRTFLQIRVGKRFGEFNVNGQLRYEPSPRLGVTASWSESVSTFGQLLTQDFNGVPVSFFIPGGNRVGFGGCILGVDPATGTCLLNWTQSITNATFRNQAGQLIIETKRGATRASLSAIYTKRRYVDTQQLQAPGSPPVDPSLANRADETISLIAGVDRDLGAGRHLSASLHGDRYRFALSHARADYYAGLWTAYRQLINRHLDARVTSSITRRFSKIDKDRTDAVVTAGLVYHF